MPPRRRQTLSLRNFQLLPSSCLRARWERAIDKPFDLKDWRESF
jgi:hypothetical protein